MSSTNKTTNYDLSQFVGSDKPAWLADYNSDMGKIDTGMKGNADAIAVTDGKADSNTTNIGNLANLNTQAKTNLVDSINEIYTTAGTAENTAISAATQANTAKSEADSLARYLSITQTEKISPSVTNATIDSNVNDMYYALNADGTLGKIYGRLRFTSTASGTITVTLPVAALSVTSQFTISNACTWFRVYSGVIDIANGRDMVVNTNGNCTLTFNSDGAGRQFTLLFAPCLYFFTDFGDVINPNN